MATAKVKAVFKDKVSGGLFHPGDTYSGTAERIGELADGGYVERPAAKPAQKQAAKPAAKASTTARKKTETKEQ